MIAEIPAEQLTNVLEQTAQEILAEAELTEPPVNAFTLAARLGLTIARDAPLLGTTSTPRARYARLNGSQPTILLADDPRPERRHWAVAHEIGEHSAHRVFAELGVDPSDAPEAAREAVANRLAGCLLLPREWFHADGVSLDWDLFALKARYATASHEMVARRMLEMPTPVIITIWDQGKPAWRRSNLGRTPPLTVCERAARQAAFELHEPARCDRNELPGGVADVRAWPIHEPDWKREIVRTELEELW